MCQSIQLVLNSLKVIIGVLVDGLLANDTPGLFCQFGGDSFIVNAKIFENNMPGQQYNGVTDDSRLSQVRDRFQSMSRSQIT